MTFINFNLRKLDLFYNFHDISARVLTKTFPRLGLKFPKKEKKEAVAEEEKPVEEKPAVEEAPVEEAAPAAEPAPAEEVLCNPCLFYLPTFVFTSFHINKPAAF